MAETIIVLGVTFVVIVVVLLVLNWIANSDSSVAPYKVYTREERLTRIEERNTKNAGKVDWVSYIEVPPDSQ